MSAIAPILVAMNPADNDENIATASTSLNKVQHGGTGSLSVSLSPEGFDTQGVARWVDRSGGIPLGYPAVTMSMRNPTKASRVSKVAVKVVLPVLEQTSASTASGIQPAPTKAYDLTFIGNFLLPDRCTLLERQAFLSLVMSLFTQSVADSAGANAFLTGTPLVSAVLTNDKPY